MLRHCDSTHRNVCISVRNISAPAMFWVVYLFIWVIPLYSISSSVFIGGAVAEAAVSFLFAIHHSFYLRSPTNSFAREELKN